VQAVTSVSAFLAVMKLADALSCSIKKWKCPEGIFVHNFSGHEAIINTLAMNEEGVMFSGGKSKRDSVSYRADEFAADNGSLTLWDYATGLPFQHLKDIPQPGSLDAEAVSVVASCRTRG